MSSSLYDRLEVVLLGYAAGEPVEAA